MFVRKINVSIKKSFDINYAAEHSNVFCFIQRLANRKLKIRTVLFKNQFSKNATNEKTIKNNHLFTNIIENNVVEFKFELLVS